MTVKQATLKELEATAVETLKPQVRYTVTTVWPDGERITVTSGPPLEVPSALETLASVWNPLLEHHHGKEMHCDDRP